MSDTAGIRDAKDEIEKRGVKLALKQAEKADLNIVVIEPKSGYFTGVLKSLITSDKTILVMNKSDLGVDIKFDEFKKLNPICISLKDDTGVNKLTYEIRNRLKSKFLVSENTLITRERHRKNLENCVLHLENFASKKELDDFDKGAEDLRLACRELGKIVGQIDVEEVLGSIFNDFCIGK
tara:strand:- start:184 stop:723 length:540 start_codon:yes stop_codon:yes gene_type:complete